MPSSPVQAVDDSPRLRAGIAVVAKSGRPYAAPGSRRGRPGFPGSSRTLSSKCWDPIVSPAPANAAMITLSTSCDHVGKPKPFCSKEFAKNISDIQLTGSAPRPVRPDKARLLRSTEEKCSTVGFDLSGVPFRPRSGDDREGSQDGSALSSLRRSRLRNTDGLRVTTGRRQTALLRSAERLASRGIVEHTRSAASLRNSS
jgi:hypothetical protein